MAGIDRHTGQVIGASDHIKQSIEVILTTPVGSRVMRRDFGFDLIDSGGAPRSGLTTQVVSNSVTGALTKYEPRIAIEDVVPHFSVDRILEKITVKYREHESGQHAEKVVTFTNSL